MSFTEWMLHNGESLQIAIFFGLLAALAALECVMPGRSRTVERASRWPTNLFFTLLNFLALGILPVSIVGVAMWADNRHWGLLNQVTLPVAAAVGITLAIRAFISFFTHYLMHRIPLFWRVHRVHHLDTELDVTTTVRFHPLEFFVQMLPAVPIVVAIGPTPWVLVVYEVLDVAVTLWTHSNTRLPSGVDRALRYVLVNTGSAPDPSLDAEGRDQQQLRSGVPVVGSRLRHVPRHATRWIRPNASGARRCPRTDGAAAVLAAWFDLSRSARRAATPGS